MRQRAGGQLGLDHRTHAWETAKPPPGTRYTNLVKNGKEFSAEERMRGTDSKWAQRLVLSRRAEKSSIVGGDTARTPCGQKAPSGAREPGSLIPNRHAGLEEISSRGRR